MFLSKIQLKYYLTWWKTTFSGNKWEIMFNIFRIFIVLSELKLDSAKISCFCLSMKVDLPSKKDKSKSYLLNQNLYLWIFLRVYKVRLHSTYHFLNISKKSNILGLSIKRPNSIQLIFHSIFYGSKPWHYWILLLDEILI